MVSIAAETILQSTQLDFRAGLDGALRADRHCRRPHLDQEADGDAYAPLVHADDTEFPVVADLFRHAEPGRRTRHHHPHADLHHRLHGADLPP
ncbi:hypothetical protein D3C86_1598040 [compost metagenome]